MKHRLLVLAALCISVFVYAQSPQPRTRHKNLVPPEPRDGEGTGTTVLPILVYHSIRPYVESDTPAVRRYIATPQVLEEELAWLRENGYQSVRFDDMVSHITSGAPLPARPVILSFDDDWEGQYRYALPLLKKYGFTATFYIWVVVVGRKNHMSWGEIRELPREGMQLGCHTLTHPYLTRIGDDSWLEHELVGAKQIIEERTGVTVTTLAYPFGQYDRRVVDAARAAGFTSARSTWPGVVHSREGLFSLTGLIRTETEANLVQTMERYLSPEPARVEGTVNPSAPPEAPAPAAGQAPAPQPPILP